jgi:predicted RNA binding protein YcfA (HicA-like mRNA interferase family)
MPKLQRVSGQDAIRAMERLGFVQVRQRGSHVVLKKKTTEGEAGCVIPLHPELAIGTLRGILRQARVTTDDFMANL